MSTKRIKVDQLGIVRFCAQEGITPILPAMHPMHEEKLYSVYSEVSGKPHGKDVAARVEKITPPAGSGLGVLLHL